MHRAQVAVATILCTVLCALCTPLFGQFVPPVRTGVAGDRSATIAPKPIPFPTDASWQRASTPHFDIISAAGERRTREIGERLETLAAALHDLRPDSAAETRARVLLFGRRRDAQPYFDVLTNRNSSHVTGLFVAQRDRGAMIIDASRENASDRTPYHELVHYLLTSNARRLPLWLEEGLAEFYSNAQLGRGELTVGYEIPEHMQQLARRVPLPVSKLFALKFESEAAAQSIFYAQSWAAVDYLIRADRNAFRDFVGDVANGVDAEAALRARFKLDSRDLAHVFAAYAIYQRTPATFRIPAPRAAVTVQPEPLRRAELLTELGRFLATFDSLTNEAERHVRAALELEPHNAAALIALAQLRMRDKKYVEAETLFASAVSAEPENAEAILAQAEGLLRDEIGPFAETNGIGTRDVERFHRARTLAERALQLGAPAGRAWGAIGITYLGDADVTPGIAALQKAHDLLPARADYALHLAALLRRSGRIAESDAILAQLDAMHDPQVSFAARAIVVTLELDRINTLVRSQKLDEAVTAINALIAKTDDPRAKAELEKQLLSLDAVRRTNAEIRAYNHAIEVSNTGRTREAIKLLDDLLATAHDPNVIDDARELRAKLRKRVEGGR